MNELLDLKVASSLPMEAIEEGYINHSYIIRD